jgi:hypothetical protein
MWNIFYARVGSNHVRSRVENAHKVIHLTKMFV